LNTGEYYRIEYSYFHDNEITNRHCDLKLDVTKEFLIKEISKLYELYKNFDVTINLLKIKVDRIPVKIQPVHVDISVDI
jgi:hypothetical protein